MSLNYTINVIGRIKVITKLQNLAKDLGPVLALLLILNPKKRMKIKLVGKWPNFGQCQFNKKSMTNSIS